MNTTTIEDEESTNYRKYRGKCKEMSEALVAENPGFRLVRGHYDCPMWGMQVHWWCEDAEGVVHDPTKLQFPSRGIGEYIEFDGWTSCENCGKKIHEDEGKPMGRFLCCSDTCCMKLVGL